VISIAFRPDFAENSKLVRCIAEDTGGPLWARQNGGQRRLPIPAGLRQLSTPVRSTLSSHWWGRTECNYRILKKLPRACSAAPGISRPSLCAQSGGRIHPACAACGQIAGDKNESADKRGNK